MEKRIFVIAIAAFFAACNSNPKTSTETTTTVDTAGFRNNSFADKGQVIELNGVSDTIVAGDGSRYVKVDPNQPTQSNVATTERAPLKTPTATRRSTSTRSTRSSGTRSTGSSSGSSNGGYSGAGTETASTPAPVPEKKGWSKAAKGAVIGAGTGAVAGAIISKKKGVGAVIGGVVGGAGGYIIGRNKDKKDGRVQ